MGLSKNYYEALTAKNVQFLQGTQQDLNKYLPNSDNSLKGKAIEGAFYLTTDTHRLYIGRKVDSIPDPNPHNISLNDIYPEEVSTGISIVRDTGALTLSANEAHDGDFYYIKEGNILAVYEENGTGGTWQQVNALTNISSFTQSFTTTSTSLDFTESTTSAKIAINSVIATGATNNNGSTALYLVAGENINFKIDDTQRGIEISAKNSQSILSVPNVAATENDVSLTLSDQYNDPSIVHFIGGQDTTVKSEIIVSTDENDLSTTSYNVTIDGPYIAGSRIVPLGSTANSTTSGWKIGIDVGKGTSGSAYNTRYQEAVSIINPEIIIGSTATGSTSTTVKFLDNIARLNVLTEQETINAINATINSFEQSFDALHYKGTINDSNTIPTSGVSIGDVYKASASFYYNPAPNSRVQTGDLLIAQGTEYQNTDSSITATYSTTASLVGTIIPGTLTWDFVPSGDEPFLQGVIDPTTAAFGLENIYFATPYSSISTTDSQAKLDRRPLYISLVSDSDGLITAKPYSNQQSADNYVIKLGHTTAHSAAPPTYVPVVVPSTTMITVNTTADTLGSTANKTLTFTALKSIEKDNYGHIINIVGSEVTLKHNYLTKLTANVSTTNIPNSSTTRATITLGAQDKSGIANNMTDANKGKIDFISDTLKMEVKEVTVSGSQVISALSMNLIWNNF